MQGSNLLLGSCKFLLLFFVLSMLTESLGSLVLNENPAGLSSCPILLTTMECDPRGFFVRYCTQMVECRQHECSESLQL